MKIGENTSISVIIPAFNAEGTIGKAVDSVLKQTIPIHEIILIDDGSTDRTAILCDAFEKQFKSVRVIHTGNRGAAAARNTGLEAATGSLIGFVDSDDRIEPQMYEVLSSAMIENDADLSACGVIQETEYGSFPDRDQDGKTVISEGTECYRAVSASSGVRGYFWNKLFKRDLIRNQIDESVLQCEDLLFLAQYLRNVRKIAYVRKPLYHYKRVEKAGHEYGHRDLSLMDAYEKILGIYLKEAPEYEPFIEYKVLKIYLNYRARSRIVSEKDPVIIKRIDSGVRSHFRQVLFSADVPLPGKANICFTYLLPGISVILKKLILSRRHEKGQWES